MFGKIVDIEVSHDAPAGVHNLADLFVAIRQRPYAMLLLSGGDLDCAGCSIMGWDPFLVLRSKETRLFCKGTGACRSAGAIPSRSWRTCWGPWNCRGSRRCHPWPPAVWDFWPMT